MLTHATTGGIISELQGGKFGHGFFSAGVAKAANVNELIGTAKEDAFLRIISAAAIGGTVSKVTGGKFANGAATAGFAQMFNGEQQAEKIENATAEIISEIHKDALTRKRQLGKLISSKNWDAIRKIYPHLSDVSDSAMYFEALTLHQEFHYIAGKTIPGQIVQEIDSNLVKPIKLALELGLSKNPRSSIEALLDFFVSIPPPIQHQFIYESGKVNIDYVRREYD